MLAGMASASWGWWRGGGPDDAKNKRTKHTDITPTASTMSTTPSMSTPGMLTPAVFESSWKGGSPLEGNSGAGSDDLSNGSNHSNHSAFYSDGVPDEGAHHDASLAAPQARSIKGRSSLASPEGVSLVPTNLIEGSSSREAAHTALLRQADAGASVSSLLSSMSAQTRQHYSMATLPADRAEHARLLAALRGRSGKTPALSASYATLPPLHVGAPLDRCGVRIALRPHRQALGAITSVLAELGILISFAATFSTTSDEELHVYTTSLMCDAVAAQLRVRLAAVLALAPDAVAIQAAADAHPPVPQTAPETAPEEVASAMVCLQQLNLQQHATTPRPPAPRPPPPTPEQPQALAPPRLAGSQKPITGLTSEDLCSMYSEFAPLDGLEVHRMLGEGSSSQVWQGTWQGAFGPEPVVLKVLRRKSPEETFLKEVHVWRQLSHPCVCALLGVCLHEQCPAIVLEHQSCGSLYDLLHTTPRFSVTGEMGDHSRMGAAHGVTTGAEAMETEAPNAAGRWGGSGARAEIVPEILPETPARLAAEAALSARLVAEVALALAYLHSRGVMHRDVKTCNVLLDAQRHAKLSDFGVATYLVPGATDDERFCCAEYTAETGTYRQMAPEVILHKPYNHKCDVYSYGMLLWETLHRRLPFESATPLQAAFAVAMQLARPPIELRDELQPYAPIITACWDVEPAERPEMEQIVELAAEMVHVLEARHAQILAHADVAC